LYIPHAQQPAAHMVFVARTTGDPMALAPSLRRAIRSLDADIPIYAVRTMDDLIRQWLRDDRMLAGFLGGLAALALSLASVGLFGMMAYLVTGRTREIGIRIALGAAKQDVLGLVMRRCLWLAVAGVIAGLLLSAPIGWALASQLCGVSGADPLSYLGVTALLLGIALMAGYLPARRALRIDPMVALRHE
jgi:ABC-type antimicrobial peptide transport system permease subunit